MFMRSPWGGAMPLRTAPYPTPLAVIAAWGAIVTNCPCSLGMMTCQFSGCSIFIGPRSALTMRWEGRTLSSATAAALGEELGTGADALVSNPVAPAGLKVAPLFL